MLGKWEKLRTRGGHLVQFQLKQAKIEQLWWVSLFVRHELPLYGVKAAEANHCSDSGDWPMSQNDLRRL